VLWRRKYLRQIKQFRAEGRTIYYLDETWVNAGHTIQKVLKDQTVGSRKEAFLRGLSTGLQNPAGKGKRLILLHIGSDKGVVDSGKLVFESKSTKDYHEEMDGKRFELWFRDILPHLDPNCIIVMDNAPYHSVKAELVPTKSWTKECIKEWLRSKNIKYDDSRLKLELYLISPALRDACNRYKIDEIAATSGRQVLRLPPYHCALNPIELVSSQIKGHVARNNRRFTLGEVRRLMEEAMQEVTPQKWKACVQHVIEKEEVKMWNLDCLTEETVERLVIDVNNSSGVSDSDEDMDGIEPYDDVSG
jgi:transposase